MSVVKSAIASFEEQGRRSSLPTEGSTEAHDGVQESNTARNNRVSRLPSLSSATKPAGTIVLDDGAFGKTLQRFSSMVHMNSAFAQEDEDGEEAGSGKLLLVPASALPAPGPPSNSLVPASLLPTPPSLLPRGPSRIARLPQHIHQQTSLPARSIGKFHSNIPFVTGSSVTKGRDVGITGIKTSIPSYKPAKPVSNFGVETSSETTSAASSNSTKGSTSTDATDKATTLPHTPLRALDEGGMSTGLRNPAATNNPEHHISTEATFTVATPTPTSFRASSYTAHSPQEFFHMGYYAAQRHLRTRYDEDVAQATTQIEETYQQRYEKELANLRLELGQQVALYSKLQLGRTEDRREMQRLRDEVEKLKATATFMQELNKESDYHQAEYTRQLMEDALTGLERAVEAYCTSVQLPMTGLTFQCGFLDESLWSSETLVRQVLMHMVYRMLDTKIWKAEEQAYQVVPIGAPAAVVSSLLAPSEDILQRGKSTHDASQQRSQSQQTVASALSKQCMWPAKMEQAAVTCADAFQAALQQALQAAGKDLAVACAVMTQPSGPLDTAWTSKSFASSAPGSGEDDGAKTEGNNASFLTIVKAAVSLRLAVSMVHSEVVLTVDGFDNPRVVRDTQHVTTGDAYHAKKADGVEGAGMVLACLRPGIRYSTVWQVAAEKACLIKQHVAAMTM